MPPWRLHEHTLRAYTLETEFSYWSDNSSITAEGLKAYYELCLMSQQCARLSAAIHDFDFWVGEPTFPDEEFRESIRSVLQATSQLASVDPGSPLDKWGVMASRWRPVLTGDLRIGFDYPGMRQKYSGPAPYYYLNYGLSEAMADLWFDLRDAA